ncbi:MAG: tRNA pseudouridine(38-40) synthase TruA [Alphaproteobacteria bacterium]|nr:tRNA pseudouridine(38-40) synthase TruA [Alphaproteobacteria bacterium]
MPRVKLTIEYDGTPFVGWQRQDNGPSVQAALEAAALAYCQTEIPVTGAGRTDAGVHALGQVAHLDIPRDDPPEKIAAALNAHLRPNPIAVLKAEIAPAEFHARFSAIERRYEYRIINRRAPLALDVARAWWLPMPLDAAAMHGAAQVLVGRHDFSTFRAAECQAESPVKTLDALNVSRQGEGIVITARARSFLHHQVRNIVGTLKLVGEGKWTARDVESALAAADRAAGGQTAPAMGLYLVGVGYP